MQKENKNLNFKVDPNFLKTLKIGIITTDYYPKLLSSLEVATKNTLEQIGLKSKNIHTFVAPGSLEIPIIAKNLLQKKCFDGLIALGIIVKGETYHFEMIANESARALMNLSLEYNIPIANEILAVYNLDQAIARTSENNQNKGIEAAIAIIKSILAIKNILTND